MTNANVGCSPLLNLFSNVFRTLVDDANDIIGPQPRLTLEQLRKIAILADTLTGGDRVDLADRLAAAKDDLDKRSPSGPHDDEAKEFCAGVKNSTRYLELHWARVALAGDKARGRLLKRARAVLEERLPAETWETLRARAPHKMIRTAVRFPSLFRLEAAWLTPGNESWMPAVVPLPSTTREPRVAFPDRDYFGLALSGGGIRSATYNLGLLQALSEKGLLDHVDYVSTVSGGGYIGGFWTAWRHRRGRPFPPLSVELTSASREHPAVRHLREFSRFLIPRLGFAQIETWNAVVATLGGVVASLVFTSAAVALLLWLSLFVACLLAALPEPYGALEFGAVTVAAHGVAEVRLHARDKLGDDPRAGRAAFLWILVGGVMAYAGWVFLSWVRPPGTAPSQGVVAWLAARRDIESCLLAPAVMWGATALLLLVLRGFGSRVLCGKWGLAFGAALDRTAGRSLSLSLVVVAFASVMATANKIDNARIAWTAAVGGSLGTAVFLWLRDWLKEPVHETRASTLFARLMAILKPVMPKVAAIVAVSLLFVGLAVLVRHVSVQRAGTQSPLDGLCGGALGRRHRRGHRARRNHGLRPGAGRAPRFLPRPHLALLPRRRRGPGPGAE